MRRLRVLVVLLSVSFAFADVFESVEKLQFLGDREFLLADEMEWLVRKFEENIDFLRSEITEMKKEAAEISEGGLDYMTNPLSGLVAIKKLSYNVDRRMKNFQNTIESFEEKVKEIRLPAEDFKGAIEGLRRLQLTYDLDSSDLAQGIIKDKKYRKPLTADELLSISNELFKSGEYFSSLSYLSLASERNEQTHEMSEVLILESFLEFHKQTINMPEVLRIIERILVIDPTRDDLRAMKTAINKNSQEAFSVEKEAKLVIKVCNSEIKRSESELAKLHCRMQSTNGFTKLAPLKMEIFNLEPFISVVHGFISDNEIDVVLKTSRKKLERAKVLNNDLTNRYDKDRIAMNCWHNDSSHEVYERLSLRVGDMSGLDMSKADRWQPQNYGIGGHYGAHFDFTTEEMKPFENGNRVATVLVFLSDVEKGGSTIFPYLSINVRPMKGLAIFWHNLSPCGNFEYLTRHVGCPVLVGSKWVANKWLHEHGQERARPCGLKPRLPDTEYHRKMFIRMNNL